LIVIFQFAGHSNQASANAPRIAVLPFTNLSGDPQQDYFSDGVVDDLITNLSRFSELSVVARNSSFAYRGTRLRAATIGRELGARYLLAGSVRRDQERLHVNVQLVDAQNEKQLWAKSYNNAVAGVHGLQNSITQEIVANLASGIRVVEARRVASLPPNTLLAYELVLRAREISFKAAGRKSTLEARELAGRAVRLDPRFAAAHVELGRTYYRAFVLEWEGAEALDHALKAAQRGVSLDQNSAPAYELLGRIWLRQGRHGDAIRTLKKAIALNVNRAETYASLADALTFAGRPSEAIPLLRKAMLLDPFYAPRTDMYLGRALYFLGDYDQAVAPLETCVARAPQFRACYMYLAPVYAELDRVRETQRVVTRLLELSPRFSVVRSVRDHLPYVDAPMSQYTASLIKAGIPES